MFQVRVPSEGPHGLIDLLLRFWIWNQMKLLGSTRPSKANRYSGSACQHVKIFAAECQDFQPWPWSPYSGLEQQLLVLEPGTFTDIHRYEWPVLLKVWQQWPEPSGTLLASWPRTPPNLQLLQTSQKSQGVTPSRVRHLLQEGAWGKGLRWTSDLGRSKRIAVIAHDILTDMHVFTFLRLV